MTTWHYHNTTTQQYDNTTQQNNMTTWQYHNTTTQQYDNSTGQINMKTWQYHNTTTQQYDNTTCIVILICHSMYVHSFATKKLWWDMQYPWTRKDWQHPVCQWPWNESHLQTCNRVWNIGALCLVDSERIPSDEYNLLLPGEWNLNSRWRQSWGVRH